MQRYFLTVGDKNPIMFNDMLCECAWVESGLQLRGPSSKVCLPPLQWLWSAEVHKCVYTLLPAHVITLRKFAMQQLLSGDRHQNAKDFHPKSSLHPLENYMEILHNIIISSEYLSWVSMVLSELFRGTINHILYASNNTVFIFFFLNIYLLSNMSHTCMS